MKPKLYDEFINFYECIKLNEQTCELKSKRDILQSILEKEMPQKLNDIGIKVNKSDLRFIDQGSYAKGVKTTINQIEGAIDRDVAVIIPIDIVEYDDPRIIKRIVKNILEIKNKRIPKIKYPCVTISYLEMGIEWLHIDFPIYAKDTDENLYLAKGKDNSTDYEWEEADPDALNNYLKNCFVTNEGKQLRRIIRYIKRWRDVKYLNSTCSTESPPSVGLTLMACKHFVYKNNDELDNDLEALYYTISKMLTEFDIYYEEDIIKATIDYNLPVKPYSNIFYKMKDSKDHQTTFYNRLSKFSDNLKNAINAETEYDSGIYIRKSLGHDFEIPDKEAQNNSTVKAENSFAR